MSAPANLLLAAARQGLCEALPEGWFKHDYQYVRAVPREGTRADFLFIQHLTVTAPPNLGWGWTISRKGHPTEVSMGYIASMNEAIAAVELAYCGCRVRR